MRGASARARPVASPSPVGSRRLLGLFQVYARRYVAKHFHAVRLARGGSHPSASVDGPILVVMNHPSWWDPMIGLVLAGSWPDRAHAAPIDAAGLAKYPFLERLGFFGIEPGTPRGALAFVRRGLAALDAPSAMLWVTAQGRFADPRERPLRLRPGVGHLASRLGSGTILPLALEYAFWDERTPEALVRFGTPIELRGSRLSPDTWTARLEHALGATLDDLAADALRRDPARFETILSGGAGVGGIYDLWRRLKAGLRGEAFSAHHGQERIESSS